MHYGGAGGQSRAVYTKPHEVQIGRALGPNPLQGEGNEQSKATSTLGSCNCKDLGIHFWSHRPDRETFPEDLACGPDEE